MSDQNSVADLLIVGCGIAGLSATVTALQSGLSTITLERSTEAEFGGGTRWTEAYLRMKNEDEVSDDFETVFAENAGSNLDPNIVVEACGGYDDWPSYVKAHPFPDPELINRFAERAPKTIGWLKEFGLKFGPQAIYLLTQNTTRIAVQGGGLALIERLRDETIALGGELRYRTTAIDLLRNTDGSVAGVLATGPDGRRVELRARNTVLASGGFQGNSEMLSRYLGPIAAHIRPVAVGGYQNKGEGIRMMLEAGAAPSGDFASYHAEPVDPRSQMPEAVIHIWPYGILVNKNGQRFLDEAPRTVDACYDPISRAIAYEPDGIAYVLFDAQTEEIEGWRRAIRTDMPAIEADTIEALAAKLELPVEAVAKTVADFNAACPTTGEFKPFEIDHLATTGLFPKKSNWARPLIKGPFRAYPIIPANCFTFGGVKVNADAQVLDCDGKPIPGLYAAGETMGIYHQVYAGSTSVLRGATFGRVAAQHAARQHNGAV